MPEMIILDADSSSEQKPFLTKNFLIAFNVIPIVFI